MRASPWAGLFDSVLMRSLVMALVGRGWLRRLIPCCNGAALSFFPWATPIPRETRNFGRHRPPRCCGPKTHPKKYYFLGTPGGAAGASPCL